MTEGQKRILMILFTALLCIVVLTMAILPMNTTIKENEETALREEKRATEMRELLDSSGARQTEYDTLRRDSQLIFERNYQSFKANEKIEEILRGVGVELRSLDIMDYAELDMTEYEMHVVQPRLPEVTRDMKSMQRGPLMSLFLVSKISIEAELTEEQMYQVIDELNNITPQAPGDAERERYCLHLPSFSVTRGEANTSFTINMYGMQPPPIDAAEIAQSED